MGLDKCMIPHRLPRWLGGKESSCPFRRHGSIPKLGSSPGEGNDNSLKYSCLENSVDRGAWWATIHGVRVGRDLGAEHTQHTMARIYHGYHTEYFHCPKSTLCSAYSSLSSLPYPQPLGTTDVFIVCRVLPFAECYIVGITLVYSDWLHLVIRIYFPIVFS